ncbi:MAG: transcription termination factor Rho, partial [Firmicutes bacterium HGW-Firmicutes-13]
MALEVETTEIKINNLEQMTLTELGKIAQHYQVKGYTQMKKKELIFALLKTAAEKEGYLFAEGVLEIMPDGFGFLRPSNYLPSSDDIYISASQIRRFDLRTGDLVSGKVRPPKENERYYALLQVGVINGMDPEL